MNSAKSLSKNCGAACQTNRHPRRYRLTGDGKPNVQGICRRITLALLFAGCLAFADTGSAQEDVASLQAQITALREEVESLKRERGDLQRELAEIKKDKEPSSKESPEGEINGIVWELTLYRPDGTALATKAFLALDGKIYADHMEVGSYTENGNRARVDITRASQPRAIGVYQFVRISNNPPIYMGRFKNDQGDNPKARLRIIKD
jgi:hypothetical protein